MRLSCLSRPFSSVLQAAESSEKTPKTPSTQSKNKQRRRAQRRDDGSVSFFVAIMAIAGVAVAMGLVDANHLITARRDAGDIAGNAARAGAQKINLSDFRTRQEVNLLTGSQDFGGTGNGDSLLFPSDLSENNAGGGIFNRIPAQGSCHRSRRETAAETAEWFACQALAQRGQKAGVTAKVVNNTLEVTVSIEVDLHLANRSRTMTVRKQAHPVHQLPQ